jgi:titin
MIDRIDLDQGGWVHSARLPADATSHTIGNLAKNHRYNFRVYAQNKIGTSEPIELSEAVKITSGIGVYSK